MATELVGKGPHQREPESAFTNLGRKSYAVVLNADPEATSQACNAYEDLARLPFRIGVLESVRGGFDDQQRDRDGKLGFHHDVIGHDMEAHPVGKGGSQGICQRLYDFGKIDGAISYAVAVQELMHSGEDAKPPGGVLQGDTRLRCRARARLEHQQRRHRLDGVLDPVIGFLHQVQLAATEGASPAKLWILICRSSALSSA